jgi:hypothetical protein
MGKVCGCCATARLRDAAVIFLKNDTVELPDLPARALILKKM